MTAPASKPRNFHRIGKLVLETFRTAPHPTGNIQDQTVALLDSVAPSQDRLYYLLPSKCTARAGLEKLQELDKDTTTENALDYPKKFEDPNSVLHGLAPEEVHAHNEVIIEFECEMYDLFSTIKRTGEELSLHIISSF